MFVPRAVKKKQAPKPVGSSSSSTVSVSGSAAERSSLGVEVSSPSVPPPARPVADASAQPRPTAKPSQQELDKIDRQAVTLLELVFSDHALWTPDELHLVARANQNQGYVPLSFLLANHPALESISGLAHPVLTRALRQHGTPGLLRTRLAITAPRAWGGSKSYGEPGVEIGRADWGTDEARLGKADEPWADRTVYVENFPAHLRGYASIALFLASLLTSGPSSASPNSIQPVVQSISFGGPTFRNFAWVVLRDKAAVDQACEDWSWAGAVGRGKKVAKGVESEREEEADAAGGAGLRILAKSDHSRLEAEYLAHLATLPPTATRVPASTLTADSARTVPPRRAAPPLTAGSAPSRTLRPEPLSPVAPARAPLPLDYPTGCLLFAKNLDPDSSNKTSLKAMFNDGLRSDEAISQGREVTYVDWSKGLDTCYVRVPHPSLAPLLLSHFARPESTVVLEIVQGDREAIYWRSNVKEPLRMEAVRVASGVAGADGGAEQRGGKKRRKM